jgi:hydroxymethylbilane synthase
MKFIIGTRGSKLALRQTEIVEEMLREKFPELSFEKKIIKTRGDKISDVPLAKIGGKGLFVKEIDEAVRRGEVSFAVHSMKDVPIDLMEDLEIASVPKREDINDALISREGLTIEELGEGSIIGTSSLRRRAEILNFRNDLRVKDLRGNVDTRIRKLREGLYDAIIMAKAGLKRLGLEEYITQDLPLDIFHPSIGQGAIAIVSREDFEGKEYLKSINHVDTMNAVRAERALLRELGGGCQVPIGAVTRVDGELSIDAVVLSPDGKRKVEAEVRGALDRAEEIGRETARVLLERGARSILEEVYKK